MKRLIALALLGLPMWAADSLQLPWNEICLKTRTYELAIKTSDGETVQGYCFGVTVSEVSISSKGKVVKVERDRVDKLVMIRKKHPLQSLGHDMLGALHFGIESLTTSAAPLGLVAIPATIAWGAVATPFCLIGELKDKLTPDRQITLK